MSKILLRELFFLSFLFKKNLEFVSFFNNKQSLLKILDNIIEIQKQHFGY